MSDQHETGRGPLTRLATRACASRDHSACSGSLSERSMFPGHPCDCRHHEDLPCPGLDCEDREHGSFIRLGNRVVKHWECGYALPEYEEE